MVGGGGGGGGCGGGGARWAPTVVINRVVRPINGLVNV